jgi:histidyl-tRNA synthetase
VQVLLQSPHSHSGIILTSAVAAGGRYDGLLKSLWSPAASALMPPPAAVGASINCEKLIKLLLQRRLASSSRSRTGSGGMAHASGGSGSNSSGMHGGLGLGLGAVERLQSSQCDVLVCARGGGGMLQVSCWQLDR